MTDVMRACDQATSLDLPGPDLTVLVAINNDYASLTVSHTRRSVYRWVLEHAPVPIQSARPPGTVTPHAARGLAVTPASRHCCAWRRRRRGCTRTGRPARPPHLAAHAHRDALSRDGTS